VASPVDPSVLLSSLFYLSDSIPVSDLDFGGSWLEPAKTSEYLGRIRQPIFGSLSPLKGS